MPITVRGIEQRAGQQHLPHSRARGRLRGEAGQGGGREDKQSRAALPQPSSWWWVGLGVSWREAHAEVVQRHPAGALLAKLAHIPGPKCGPTTAPASKPPLLAAPTHIGRRANARQQGKSGVGPAVVISLRALLPPAADAHSRHGRPPAAPPAALPCPGACTQGRSLVYLQATSRALIVCPAGRGAAVRSHRQTHTTNLLVRASRAPRKAAALLCTPGRSSGRA